MKARIINGTDWGGNHPQQWLDDNQNIFFGGQLVSEWELTEILPIDKTYTQWNGVSWIQNLQEINQIKINKAIEIDMYYTKKISDLMIKHNDKLLESIYTGNTYIIPQSALDAKQALKNECNAKIAELGITDYTYRQSIPKLAKTLNI